MMQQITVIDVFRSLGVEPEKRITWSVGLKAQFIYRKRFGRQPPKDNRTKTSGVGVHCFALYPEDMRGEIADLILQHEVEASKQLSLL